MLPVNLRQLLHKRSRGKVGFEDMFKIFELIRTVTGFVGIEDKDNWHGKPLGDKAAEVIKAIEGRLHKVERTPVTLSPPTVVVPPVNISGVTLNEAPKYSLGDKV